MKLCYIYHVIGTLTMEHIERSLESLREQQPFHWDRFVLYNGSDLSTTTILEHVPREFFDKIEVFTYDPSWPKSCSFDWFMQMRQIEGADRYFVHKADFYLPPWVCTEFEHWPGDSDFIILFNKYDMKSRATIDDIRRFARQPWAMGLLEPDVGSYERHLNKIAIPFMQVKGGADGTMHAYTNGVRDLYDPDMTEMHQRWGVAVSFRKLERTCSRLFVHDPRFFACHMWHETPDRNDWNKNMSPEERF